MRAKGAAGAAHPLPCSVPQALGRHTEGPSRISNGIPDPWNSTDPWHRQENAVWAQWDTKPPQSDSVLPLLGLGLGCWQGWSPAGWIFVPPALAKPNEVLNQVWGNFSTGPNSHEASRLSLSLPSPGVPPAGTDSLLFPAACGRTCYSKVLLGVIRIKRGLALQRTQP